MTKFARLGLHLQPYRDDIIQASRSSGKDAVSSSRSPGTAKESSWELFL